MNTIPIEEEQKTNLPKDMIKDLVLDCFLHHKLKLIRNWGSVDNTDQLPFKDATMLQFVTNSVNFQILIKPKEGEIVLIHSTKQGRKLYLYFMEKIQSMRLGTYKPTFSSEPK